MAKKLTVVFIAILLVAACCLTMAACDQDKTDDRLTIVYIGDSIAEALIGPSPLAERDNYGYYAVVGKTNNMRYFNHSVSGHKTSTNMLPSDDDDIGGLLGMLYGGAAGEPQDKNAALMISHLKQADIVHISVLGNNILQYNLGLLLYEVATRADDFKEGEGDTLLDLLYTGSRQRLDSKDEHGRYEYLPFAANPKNTRYDFDANGDPDPSKPVYFDFPPTYDDLQNIIARIRELNPTATIIFQTVYNPFYQDSSHLKDPVKKALSKIKDENGDCIETIEQYRALADKLLDILNNLISKYKKEFKPTDFEILDINKAFDDVTKMDVKENGDVNLASDCYGRQLIFQDWTHPSNFGHAVIACETQKTLEKLGYADKNALANYKALRLDQLDRLYSEAPAEAVSKIRDDINKATDFYGVTFAYFDGVRGYTPTNY